MAWYCTGTNDYIHTHAPMARHRACKQANIIVGVEGRVVMIVEPPLAATSLVTTVVRFSHSVPCEKCAAGMYKLAHLKMAQ